MNNEINLKHDCGPDKTQQTFLHLKQLLEKKYEFPRI